jgi:hypothetical protein
MDETINHNAADNRRDEILDELAAVEDPDSGYPLNNLESNLLESNIPEDKVTRRQAKPDFQKPVDAVGRKTAASRNAKRVLRKTDKKTQGCEVVGDPLDCRKLLIDSLLQLRYALQLQWLGAIIQHRSVKCPLLQFCRICDQVCAGNYIRPCTTFVPPQTPTFSPLQRKEGCEKPRKRKQMVHQGGSFSFQTNGGITIINANTYSGPVTYINSCNSSQNQTR